MSSDAAAISRYTEGTYWTQHSDWHLGHSAGKANDLLPSFLAIIERMKDDSLHIADVGAGAGGVLAEVVKRIHAKYPQIVIDATAIEVSPAAVAEANRLFPDLRTKCKLLDASDGPFTALMLVDVLEHLENPWEMLRTVAQVSQFLVVRQPLLEGYGSFRHRSYKLQREKWGHISYFTEPSFIDMAESTGWKPIHTEIVAPWELKTLQSGKGPLLKRILVRLNRRRAAYFLSGFYLMGAFERTATVY